MQAGACASADTGMDAPQVRPGPHSRHRDICRATAAARPATLAVPPMRARAYDAPGFFGPLAGRLDRTIRPIRLLRCAASGPSRKSVPAHGRNQAPKPDHGDSVRAGSRYRAHRARLSRVQPRQARPLCRRIEAGCHATPARRHLPTTTPV